MTKSVLHQCTMHQSMQLNEKPQQQLKLTWLRSSSYNKEKLSFLKKQPKEPFGQKNKSSTLLIALK